MREEFNVEWTEKLSMHDVFTNQGVFRKPNGVIQISVRPTLVATATKCCHLDTIFAITQLVHEISPRFLHQTGGFGGRPN